MAKNKDAAATVSKGSKFGRGMLIYALVFLLIISGVLAWFYVKMAAYERSRPDYVLEKYISEVDHSKINALAAEMIAEVSPDIQSEDECYQVLTDMVKGSKYVKNIKECTDYELSYYLKYDDTLIENIVLTLGKEDQFGYIPWTVESDELLVDNILHEKTLVLKPGGTVTVDGKELPDSHIVDDNTPIPIIKDFYEQYSDLPHYETWDTGKYIGNLAVVVTDASGNLVDEAEYTTPPEYEDNCTEKEKSEIKALMDDYIDAYVTFTSGTNKNPYSNYYEVSLFTIDGSALQQRLHDAIGGFGFASSLGDDINSITINRCMNLGNDRYAADVTYVVTTTGSNGMVSTNDYNGIFILSRNEDGELRAENETTY